MAQEVKFTPGPWHWVIHDHSCASLGVGDDPGMGTPLVMSVSPCCSCTERAEPKEWKWGRCTTPNEADARLIAAAPELYRELRGARCPRPCNQRPDEFEIGQCVDAGECGCSLGGAVLKAEGR